MLKFLLIIPILQIVCTSAQHSEVQNASQTESPWMVFIEVKGRRCGGAMITDTHILTAAHCFDRMRYSELINLPKLREHLKIRIGEWKTESDPDCAEDTSDEICDTTADILPKEVIIHKDYNKRNQEARFQYDIAIIKLGWPPRRSEVINVLPLADPERCYEATSGEFWKTTGFGGGSKIKKRMEMVLLSHEECVKSIDQSHLKKLNEEVHVCGRGLSGEKTCKGDAGNPVTNLIEGINYLQGIVTFTDEDECVETETNTASVFLRVPCFYDWIHSKVPNISQAFTTTLPPPPQSGENKDTGSIEVVVAGEDTTAKPLGTTKRSVKPPATAAPQQTTKPATYRTRSTSAIPPTPRPTQPKYTAPVTQSVGQHDSEEGDHDEEHATKPTITTTTRPIRRTTQPVTQSVGQDYSGEVEGHATERTTTTRKTTKSWRRPSTAKTAPTITTTEDPNLHFLNEVDPQTPLTSGSSSHASASSQSGDIGNGMYDIRMGEDGDEGATSTTIKPKLTRTTKAQVKAAAENDY